MKIDENSKYWQRSSSYLLNGSRNFDFWKDVTFDNVKSHQGFTLSLEDTFFEKPQGRGGRGGQIDPQPF